MLQSVVMVMLLIRMMSNLTFQPRLAVISSTIFASVSDVAHILAIVTGMVSMRFQWFKFDRDY
jgi:hypothetical protein